MARVVVAGYMVRHPLAGNLFAFLHYVIGLHRLGHRVTYVETSGWLNACYDPTTATYGPDPSYGLTVVRQLLDRWAPGTTLTFIDNARGAEPGEAFIADLDAADVLLDIGGASWLPTFRRARRLALVDMDPLFTQLGRFAGARLDDYQTLLSYGVNIGAAGCEIPTNGRTWIATVPPVVNDLWCRLSAPSAELGLYTTVASWDSYGTVESDGRIYGQKDVEFRRFIDVPRHVPNRLEIALGGGHDVRALLRNYGWSVIDAHQVTSDIDAYQAYVSGSRGEFSVAKHAYVSTQSGWFSDRTVCYLAAGRPVVVQDTGFLRWLGSTSGITPFVDVPGAVSALAAVESAWDTHSRAAAAVAREVFDSAIVLNRLLEAVS